MKKPYITPKAEIAAACTGTMLAGSTNPDNISFDVPDDGTLDVEDEGYAD